LPTSCFLVSEIFFVAGGGAPLLRLSLLVQLGSCRSWRRCVSAAAFLLLRSRPLRNWRKCVFAAAVPSRSAGILPQLAENGLCCGCPLSFGWDLAAVGGCVSLRRLSLLVQLGSFRSWWMCVSAAAVPSRSAEISPQLAEKGLCCGCPFSFG